MQQETIEKMNKVGRITAAIDRVLLAHPDGRYGLKDAIELARLKRQRKDLLKLLPTIHLATENGVTTETHIRHRDGRPLEDRQPPTLPRPQRPRQPGGPFVYPD